jgi:hypothetical protein
MNSAESGCTVLEANLVQELHTVHVLPYGSKQVLCARSVGGIVFFKNDGSICARWQIQMHAPGCTQFDPIDSVLRARMQALCDQEYNF